MLDFVAPHMWTAAGINSCRNDPIQSPADGWRLKKREPKSLCTQLMGGGWYRGLADSPVLHR